jgi:hypothetical protein
MPNVQPDPLLARTHLPLPATDRLPNRSLRNCLYRRFLPVSDIAVSLCRGDPRRGRGDHAALRTRASSDVGGVPTRHDALPTNGRRANGDAHPIRLPRPGAPVPPPPTRDDARVPNRGCSESTSLGRATDYFDPSHLSAPAGGHTRRRRDAAGAISPSPDA